MEKVKISLVDNNYTTVFDTELQLDAAQASKLNTLLNHVQDGLYSRHEHKLAFSGQGTAMNLTVTGCDKC